jgi:hypothetical protein
MSYGTQVAYHTLSSALHDTMMCEIANREKGTLPTLKKDPHIFHGNHGDPLTAKSCSNPLPI